MVALNFYHTVFNRAAGAAQLLELLRQGGYGLLIRGKARNHRDSFAAPVLAVAHHARDAIILCCRRLIGCRCIAPALFIGLATPGAGIDPAAVGGIYKSI